MATIAKTGCGKFVFDRYGSHVDIPSNVLKDALFRLQIPEGATYTYTSVRLPYQAGYNIVVPAEEGEEIFYAMRSGNKLLSRFVVKNPIPTKYVSFELKKLEKVENEWLLLSSHIGFKRHPEIDLTEGIGPMEEDLVFWNSHAFCWGYTAIVPGTITHSCPWEP